MTSVRVVGGIIVVVGFVLFISMPILVMSYSPYCALTVFFSILMIAVGSVLFKTGGGVTKQDFLTEQVFEVPSREDPHVVPSDSGYGNGYCPGCGSPLSHGDQYCGVCGRRLRCRTGS